MSGQCSYAFGLIVNLYNAAKWHKLHCHESCNVSISQLKGIVAFFKEEIWEQEYEQVQTMLKDWPII